jgi:N6-L-threonylcarbamoyladenine synthase
MALTVLGIETSCDETAAAVYQEGVGVLSSALFSQINLHQPYGGVVPEIASRSHLEKINPILEQALTQAQQTIITLARQAKPDSKIEEELSYQKALEAIDVIAVTNKPGLPGSLLVGVCFAKSLAWTLNKPIVGVDHQEAHIFSSFLENEVPFPHLCLAASGGHTALYLVHDFGSYETLGQTLDDAAGEAFDKISKLLNLGYPGGPLIEQQAAAVDFQDFFSYPRGIQQTTLDFSFSGLKTAVLYDLVKRDAYNLHEKKLLDNSPELKQKVASSLLICISDIFKNKIERALKSMPSHAKKQPEIKAVTFVGGVACNKYIKAQLQNLCEKHKLPFFVPAPKYCGDNAAMVTFVGYYKAKRNQISDLFLDILK